MEAPREGENSSEMEFTDIETTSASLNSSVVFHVVIDILGFVLFMHQQIPSILQDISIKFDELKAEYKDLETAVSNTEANKGCLRRRQLARKREVKHGIRRLEKLMNSISNVKAALQLVITEIPMIQRVILIVGPSPSRPLHVYEMCFPHARAVSADFAGSKAAEALSKKAIRVLISKGAGSDSCAGPTKLFLLVKAPSSFSVPSHFLPKRDFRYNKKVVPFRLRFRSQSRNLDVYHDDTQTASSVSISLMASEAKDMIWFQCRYTIKGLVNRASPSDE